jgi:hypothetical protein
MSDTEQTEDKPKKDRSPSFPFISLPKAIDRAQTFAANHKRAASRVPAIAPTWGYGLKSSGLLQTIAALKAFGLLEDFGSGDERKVQLTDLAWRIMHDARPGAREAAIQEAALRPRLIAEYAKEWLPERPGDAHCISELQFDRNFTPEAAKVFLKVFDETVSFANLRDLDSLSPSIEDRDERREASGSQSNPAAKPRIDVGDLVQCEVQGAWVFPEPRRVREIRHDPTHGAYVFVEGVGGGFPLGQAQLIERAAANPVPNVISPSPIPSETKVYAPTVASTPATKAVSRATFPLPEGLAALELPERLTKESFEDIKAWIDVMLRRAQRSIRDEETQA